MTDPQLTATLLANGPYVRSDAPYRQLEVRGPDAGEFLQRLCTQNVQSMPEGEVLPAAMLDAKGKVRATCLVSRVGEAFTLEMHAEQLEPLAESLERYHFTEKLSIATLPDDGCTERVSAARGEHSSASRDDGRLAIVYERRGVRFERHYGSGPAADGAALTAELAECLRMCAGLVRVGIETEAATLALEADLDDHCSTRKGCYTGQEIVARIHTYGHVNRKLCLLRLPAGETITAPVALHEPEDDIPVGRVMHAVQPTGHEFRVGLGYLPKDFQAIGTKLTLAGEAAVEVVGF